MCHRRNRDRHSRGDPRCMTIRLFRTVPIVHGQRPLKPSPTPSVETSQGIETASSLSSSSYDLDFTPLHSNQSAPFIPETTRDLQVSRRGGSEREVDFEI